MLVESHAVLREAADRTQAKRSALDLATSGQADWTADTGRRQASGREGQNQPVV